MRWVGGFPISSFSFYSVKNLQYNLVYTLLLPQAYFGPISAGLSYFKNTLSQLGQAQIIII